MVALVATSATTALLLVPAADLGRLHHLTPSRWSEVDLPPWLLVRRRLPLLAGLTASVRAPDLPQSAQTEG